MSNYNNFIDIIGQTFGRWTVLKQFGNQKRRDGKTGEAQWFCQCQCGNTGVRVGQQLRSGHTKSCGCLRHKPSTMTHGHTRGHKSTREYESWKDAKKRCFNPNNQAYKNYGARGITMCEEWRESFESFLRDMGPCHAGMTIERKDNDLGYFPSNCRWATRKEQTRNTRRNRLITHGGLTLTAIEWSEQMNLPRGMIRNRIDNLHWSIERALTSPPSF